MARNVPNIQDLQKYDVNRPGAAEVVRQTLYDFQVYPTAGNTSFQFFAFPLGQGITSSPGAVVGSAKTVNDTNMTLAGQLPAPQAFIAESVEVVFIPGNTGTANTFVTQSPISFATAAAVAIGNAVADIYSVLNGGVLRFTIGSKDYLIEAGLTRFPPKAKTTLDVACATTSAAAGEVFAAIAHAEGRPYYLEPPVTLRASQNFGVRIEFPAAIATPSTFNGRIGIILDGWLFRNSQ